MNGTTVDGSGTSGVSVDQYVGMSDRVSSLVEFRATVRDHYATKDWVNDKLDGFKVTTLEKDYVAKKWLYAKVAGVVFVITVVGSGASTAIVQALVKP